MKTCPTCQAGYPTNFAVCPQDGTPLVEVGAWSPGAVVRGKYRILEKIGQGGMGAVYKALHVTFDELRAIKVISPELMNDQLFVRRFKHEAVITRKLQHPNAVRVDDIDESEEGRPFIVMEFIEGESLRKLIHEQGAMPVIRVCSVIKQAAAALEAAHRLGMIHRDIKPDNIVLVQTPEGEQAKVLDFGIAKLKEGRRGDMAGMTLTGTGVVIGTPQYMSPEQAMGWRGDQLDGRSDLYSLGIVMYQMLTGDLPFKADTTMEMLLAHLQQPPPDVRATRPELQIPGAVAGVVMRLLGKKPESRPANAGALIAEIERAEMELGGPGETQLIQTEEIFEQPFNPPPSVPAPRQPTAPRRAATGPLTPQPRASRRGDVPPSVDVHRPVQPPRSVEFQRPLEPRPAPGPPYRVPTPAARVQRPSQWGIWAGLAILLVGLAGGVRYFTERQPSGATEPQSAPAAVQPAVPSAPSSPAHQPEPTPAPSSQPGVPLPTTGEGEAAPAPSSGTSTTKTTTGRTGPASGLAQPTVRRPPTEVVTRPQPVAQPQPLAEPPAQPAKPAVDPRKITAAIKMGDFYFERGEYDKAVDEFEQGLALDPSNQDLKNRIARVKSAKAAEDRLNQ